MVQVSGGPRVTRPLVQAVLSSASGFEPGVERRRRRERARRPCDGARPAGRGGLPGGNLSAARVPEFGLVPADGSGAAGQSGARRHRGRAGAAHHQRLLRATAGRRRQRATRRVGPGRLRLASRLVRSQRSLRHPAALRRPTARAEHAELRPLPEPRGRCRDRSRHRGAERGAGGPGLARSGAPAARGRRPRAVDRAEVALREVAAGAELPRGRSWA